jgi:hypothetical protein
MQFHRILSRCFVAAALVATPIAASAEPAPVAAQLTGVAEQQPAAVTDAERYAELEKESPATAKFEGGARGIYIGGGALTIVLIVLLLVIIL